MESLWHLRAALNVAAMSCRGSKQLISSEYNRLLSVHRASLAVAYAQEQARFRSGGAEGARRFDQHQTRLYNFFALPKAQPAFCRSANRALARLNAMPSTGLEKAAPATLAEVEAPFI